MLYETMEKLALLLLGWLLGLLAPIIVDAIKRRRENTLGRDAISTELSSLKVKLALCCYLIEEHQGTMTRQSLKWLIKQLGTESADTEALKTSAALKPLLQFSDEQLEKYFLSQKAPTGKSLNLQQYGTPLLDARVSALWSFDTTTQRTLLEIRSALDFNAETVERTKYYNNLTFQKLENGNHALVVENIEGCYKQYATQAKRIIEFIEKFESIN
jgi:hypothetical protein